MEFSREELKAVLTLGIIAGIIVAFSDTVVLRAGRLLVETTGLLILVVTVLGMIISVLVHELGHKFAARFFGYYTHVESYYAGQVFGLVVAIASFGWIQFFTPNTSDLEANPQQRIHRFRKYENPKQEAMISMSGIIVTGVLATMLHGAYLMTGSEVIYNLLLGNIWIMVYSLIPFELLSLYLLRVQQSIEQLPQSDGLYILHYSLISYVFASSFVLVLSLFLVFTTIIGLWIALFIAMIVTLYVWTRFFLEANK